MKKNNPIVLTPGEPAGVGPDILIKLSQQDWPIRLVACADPYLLTERAKQLNLMLKLIHYSPDPLNNQNYQKAKTLEILPINLIKKSNPGQLNKENGYYVIKTLERACNGCINGEFSALVTGPINKKIINDSGIKFTGHTEFLAKQSNVKKVVMMLSDKKLRIALATTHIPLKEVANEISFNNLKETIRIIHKDLKTKFKIKDPTIYICGLNPHAGEGGYIGFEEIDIIIPVIKYLHKKGMRVYGPFPADSLFQPKYLNNADVILTMYHDQGLPILKYRNFNSAVNITLGLPFIRTSVDHGTAIDIAGTQRPNPKSFIKALKTAINLL